MSKVTIMKDEVMNGICHGR